MRQRGGFALPLVLGIIVILVAVAASLAMTTRRATKATSRYRDQVSERYAAESGLTVAVSNIESALLSGREDRKKYLNHLPPARVELYQARVVVSVVDIASLLDLNMADENTLARLFTYFIDQRAAERGAHTVRTRMNERPLRSIRELQGMENVPIGALQYLTLDGDGYINTVTASDTVRNVARGARSDEPTRLLLISRAAGTELRAVYGIVGNDLVLIRWEETQK